MLMKRLFMTDDLTPYDYHQYRNIPDRRPNSITGLPNGVTPRNGGYVAQVRRVESKYAHKPCVVQTIVFFGIKMKKKNMLKK